MKIRIYHETIGEFESENDCLSFSYLDDVSKEEYFAFLHDLEEADRQEIDKIVDDVSNMICEARRILEKYQNDYKDHY